MSSPIPGRDYLENPEIETDEDLLVRDDEYKEIVRESWTSNYGLTTKDIMKDEKGDEYIIVSLEDEKCNIHEHKQYLPEKLQINYTPF